MEAPEGPEQDKGTPLQVRMAVSHAVLPSVLWSLLVEHSLWL